MRIGFLLLSAYTVGGTERTVITQANALVDLGHDVTLLSVLRGGETPHYAVDPRVEIRPLADIRDQAPEAPTRESALIPARWDRQFSALTDVALESGLRDLDVDVLVTVTPALLAAAVQLLPRSVVVIHQEHRSSSQRTNGMEPLLAFAPQADVVALLTPTMQTWLHQTLGPVTPHTVVMPNALPHGTAPRSLLDSRTIVSAGRLVMEKQFTKLVHAFADIADDLPGWRLRILGAGHQRPHLIRETRKRGLYDRVELPGTVTDMASEWAKASICALTSRAEGFPLVLQEAMAAGVPCVSFDCASGPREIVRHDVNGLLVTPESLAGLSSALKRVATDDGLRGRLGAGALATASEWDAGTIAARWVEVFKEAVARRSGRARFAARSSTPPLTLDRAPASEHADVTPQAARDAALDLATRAAHSASDVSWVIPAPPLGAPVVVVPSDARDRFLAVLADLEGPSYLSLRDPEQGGWPERRGSIRTLAQDLRRGRTGWLALEPWPTDAEGRTHVLSQRCGVDVEFWEESVDGQLVAPRANAHATRVPRTGSTVLDLSVPTIDQCTFPVDVVYTWVDGNDPEWNSARESRLAQVTGTATTRESSGRARFVSRNELRYSLRSVHLFAPWVRRIFLVTAGQVPGWLATDAGVTVVDHREILPADALPTFNSHAIETALHRIPGLAEHFVYFNDDFFLGRPVAPETFFDGAGRTAVVRAPSTIGTPGDPGAAPYLKAAWNNRRLLREAFGRDLTHNLAHVPYAHRVSTLTEIGERFAAEVTATAHSPFRSDTDVSMLSSFAQHYGLMSGTAYWSDLPRAYINLANSDLDWQLKRALQRDQDFLCLADHHDHALKAARLDETIEAFMAAYLPIAAPWELEP